MQGCANRITICAPTAVARLTPPKQEVRTSSKSGGALRVLTRPLPLSRFGGLATPCQAAQIKATASTSCMVLFWLLWLRLAASCLGAAASEWPTWGELNLNETRTISRNGGAPHRFKLRAITHQTMPYRRNAADGTIIYAATVEMEIDGVPVTLTARPYQFPTVVGGLRVLIENTKTWSESGTVAATPQAKDLSFTFTHVGESWGPADARFPIGSFRWHATSYHNTWMGLVPQDDQVYYHRGEDFGAQPNLLPVLAPRAGAVTALPSVRLRDANGAVYQFYHMFEDHLYVTVGQNVEAGFTLAHTGGQGNGNDDQHLHVTVTAPDGTVRNTYPMMAETYLRDYPDSGIANAGGYQFTLPGQSITLDASRSLARPGRTITGYRWILHDGAEVAGRTANLTIATPGYFAQELRVTYDDGSEQRDFTPVRVFNASGAGQAGMLGLIYQHPVRGIRPGAPVTLMHNPWMVGVNSRTIDFGDGSSPQVVAGHKPAMTHAYAAPGLYTVTISVGPSQVLKTSVLVEGTLFAHAPSPGNSRPAVPRLQFTDNHRRRITAADQPYFWLGDTATALLHRLDRAEAEQQVGRALKHCVIDRYTTVTGDL